MKYPDNHDADDGYDYNMVDDGPEAEPTKPKESDPVKSRSTPTDFSPLSGADGTHDSLVEVIPHIFQRRAGGRRAKVPTDIDADLEKGIDGSEIIDREKPRDVDSESAHINLCWTMTEIDGRRIPQLSCDKIDKVAQKPPAKRQRVRWQHSNQTAMQLDTFEGLVRRCQSQGMSKSLQGLTRRLFKRVRSIAERDFVGGRYLTPLALRYDNQDESRYTVDKTCVFFSFPYFLVAKPELKKYFGKNDPRHPPRTLLQSRYNNILARDEDQCISLLKTDSLASLLKTPFRPEPLWSSRSLDHVVFVPQLWGIIDGLDTLISSGPIDNVTLRRSALSVVESIPRPLGHTLSLVRFLFENQGRQEELIYPAIQCNSWFGLLNKQQQILKFLGHEGDQLNPSDYRFWFSPQRPITVSNWTSLRRFAQSSEILDIWMKKNAPRTDAHSADVDIPENPDQVPFITAFFAWNIRNEFGETDDIALPDRVDRFLKAICSHVMAETQVMIDAKSEPQLEEYLQTFSEDSMAFKLAQEFQLMFSLYVPLGQYSVSRHVKMYWGAVYEIIETFNDEPTLDSTLKKYSTMVSDIIFYAQRLHQGVFGLRSVQDEASKEWRTENAISHSAVLLAVVVDAFGSILRMIIETLKALRTREEIIDIKAGPTQKITDHGKEACRLLKVARDQLINEANGQNEHEDIGPIVTPEAIAIALLDRLASGVFLDGAFDIILLYKECLDCLAIKVRNEASRRLLQKLNGFQEEITIIKGVLKEQDNVLSTLRASFDPRSLSTPSITRRLRYDFERKAIDRILMRVREQMADCDELTERAKFHAIQNVQLVETFQDDISKAVFVFTTITILFLPMSFVAGFFGMNVIGISNDTTTLRHFWTVSLSLTFGIVIPCTVIALKGEEVFFVIARMYRGCKRVWSSKN